MPKPSTPRRKTPTKKPSPKDDSSISAKSIQHYNAILIEDLKSEFRFVVEHVSTLNQSLRGEINQMKVENNERFDRIETVLKSHSRMLQENEKRWKDNEKRWEDNEKRLERIETKLDDVVEKVERHDQEISVLKSRPLVS